MYSPTHERTKTLLGVFLSNGDSLSVGRALTTRSFSKFSVSCYNFVKVSDERMASFAMTDYISKDISGVESNDEFLIYLWRCHELPGLSNYQPYR